MKREERLLDRLKLYSQGDFYPFHMPGHKRNCFMGQEYTDPFQIDITEIGGFDNLHQPDGILKESMSWAASVYGADKTYYLVNGSSCGLLTAICGSTSFGGKILMARNCHKSAYNAVFLNHLEVRYVYPQVVEELGIQGGILPEDVEEILQEDSEIQAVLIVSPTYEGIVSDIKRIAEIVHRQNIPLIVDEAHGAHFTFGKNFPVSALDLGADIVIQSIHKTLPCFTQTAVLHTKKGYVKEEEIERYLRIYQSSSPSYIFMAGIENCIYYMNGEGREKMDELSDRISQVRKKLGDLKNLAIAGEELEGNYGVNDIDLSKLVIVTKNTKITGADLDRILREKYHLEMEMCGADYVVAIITIGDSEEGFERLIKALYEIDGEVGLQEGKKNADTSLEWSMKVTSKPEVEMTIFEGIAGEKESIPVENSVGRISGEFVYIYPPGIPILAPGEMLLPSLVHTILEYEEMGLPVQGLRDISGKNIQVIKTGK
ncbi:aminotransferase class I/II-fold pyridoxal phosphate-dependent enzyme [Lachnoclostridium edouardi]|uniref:aminotransferase class I/II-fold pyridoxal phosphate-dependent enzyme n=1 Tax=Lachnoclostridium edouardi TaxID=1926283 RepID=UPI000C79851D|nr:aminotransferase class V-fold PLP-dependent enzyme [Lachnoclostridium edouardi]